MSVAESTQFLIEAAARLLEERLGIAVTTDGRHPPGWDARVRLSYAGAENELWVEAKDHVGDREIESYVRQARDTGARALLVAHSLAPRMRERLRTAGVNHVDLAGNLFIRESGLYVWLDADRKPPPLTRLRSERPLNPFSKRASLVLRTLLEQAERSWGVRELSAETGLSVGHTSDIARSLVDRGYVAAVEDQLVLHDPVAALRDWIEVYNWRKNPRESFLVPFEYEELVPRLGRALDEESVPYALTLLAGAALVAPHVQHAQLHLYIAEAAITRGLRAVTERLYGEPALTGGNVHLLLPYYREATFVGQRRENGLPVVSTVQLFLDLAGYPLRGAEAARMLVKGPLARQLDLDRSQVQALSSAVE
jgi:hypothetical protein